MTDPTSRYAAIEAATWLSPEGRLIAYSRRRFLPQGAEMSVAAEIAVAQNERLDAIAARALGDPLHFWRLCDANDAIDPLELVAEAGRLLRVPVPQF